MSLPGLSSVSGELMDVWSRRSRAAGVRRRARAWRSRGALVPRSCGLVPFGGQFGAVFGRKEKRSCTRCFLKPSY